MANPAPESIVEAVIIPVANKGLLVGAATGVAGWLSQVNWIGLSGVLVAVLGLVISAYFQIRRDRRETIESQERIRVMREQCKL
jgi:membrane associated rhomboid family serine protease